MDPVLKATSSDVQSKEKPVTLTSVKDRTSNLEALTLAFAAEKGLSLSSVPDLIEYAKVSCLLFSIKLRSTVLDHMKKLIVICANLLKGK